MQYSHVPHQPQRTAADRTNEKGASKNPHGRHTEEAPRIQNTERQEYSQSDEHQDGTQSSRKPPSRATGVVAASRYACRSNSGLVITLNGTPVDAINPLSKDPPDTDATTRTCRIATSQR